MPPPLAAGKQFEIAIIGGGITGITLAIALCKRNIRCTIYEQASAFGEIGAGVGMHPNAVRAMRICDEDMIAAFQKVSTRNLWESKKTVWFDFLDGLSTQPARNMTPLFTIYGHQEEGHAACHRARFLEELVKLLPDGISHFNKRLENIFHEPHGSGMVHMVFQDGSEAKADAVIGCDGIKSRTRELIVGESSAEARCGYSYKYAYRGLIPMEDAIEALGEEKAANACVWMGPDRHVLTFPVNHGATLNLVAFVTSKDDWPSRTNLTLPSTQGEALHDFKGWGPNVLRLIRLTENKPDRWGLFDLADHPLSTFYNGRICVAGDAAHASTPHHGAGAGFCMEDCAILSSLLADERVQMATDLEAVFAAFDENRRERDQWLVQSSRKAADMYEWRAPDIGMKFDQAIQEEIKTRQSYIWDVNLDHAIDDARVRLGQKLPRGGTP